MAKVSAKMTASAKVSEAAIARVRAIYAGAPNRVHRHRLTVGLHEMHGAHDAKVDYFGEPTDAQVIDAGYFAEFGLGQPQRSWLRAWFDANVDRLKAESTEAMRKEFNGDGDAVLLLARKWSTEIRDGITSGDLALAPLSDRTKAQRAKAGLSEGPPLFATGQLVEAIHGMADAEVVG